MSDRTKGIIALIFLAIVSGGIGVLMRYLDQYFGLFQQVYLRLFLAFILGLFFFRKHLDFSKLKKISKKEWLLILSRSLSSFIGAIPLWIMGVSIAKLANVGFIDSLPLTAAFSLLLGLEKMTLRKILFVLLSFVGVVILSVKNFNSLTSFGYGEFLILISGFFFAYRNFSRIWHTKLLNDAEITQIMFFLGFIMVFVASLVVGEKMALPSWNPELAFMLFLGGVFMIINIFLNNYAFHRVNPVLGNNLLNLEAVFAIFFGFFFYGELTTLRELLGGALIIASAVGMEKFKL